MEQNKHYDQLHTRINTELNMWMDSVVAFTRSVNRKKISKQDIIESSIEYMKSCDLDWSVIKNKDDIVQAMMNNKLD